MSDYPPYEYIDYIGFTDYIQIVDFGWPWLHKNDGVGVISDGGNSTTDATITITDNVNTFDIGWAWLHYKDDVGIIADSLSVAVGTNLTEPIALSDSCQINVINTIVQLVSRVGVVTDELYSITYGGPLFTEAVTILDLSTPLVTASISCEDFIEIEGFSSEIYKSPISDSIGTITESAKLLVSLKVAEAVSIQDATSSKIITIQPQTDMVVIFDTVNQNLIDNIVVTESIYIIDRSILSLGSGIRHV